MLKLNKCSQLLYKDILMQKSVLALGVLYSTVVCSVKKGVYLYGVFFTFIAAVVFLVCFAGVKYCYGDKAGKGTEFLLTASYRRRDIVFSRCLFLLILVFIQFLVGGAALYFSLGFGGILSLNLLGVLAFSILSAGISVSLVLPVSFLDIGFFSKMIFSFLVLGLLEVVSTFVDINNLINSLSSKFMLFVSMLSFVVFVCFSVVISNRIFESRDL